MNNNYKCNECGKEIKTTPIYGYIEVEGNSASTPLLCNKCSMIRLLSNKQIMEIPIIMIEDCKLGYRWK